jgi:hypothetical protein
MISPGKKESEKNKMGKKTSMSLLNQVVVKPPHPQAFESYVLRSSVTSPL